MIHTARALTVVSITPVPLARDSRTLKMAHTFASMGMRSVVLEGGHDRLRPVDLQCIVPGATVPRPVPKAAAPPRLRARVIQSLMSGSGGGPRGAVGALVYSLAHFKAFCVREAFRLPAADLYYLHDFRHAPAVRFAAWRYRAPFIYDAHDFYSGLRKDGDLTEFQRTRVEKFLEREEQRCCDSASRVVTVSEGLADLLRNKFGCSATVIRNVHDPRLDTPDAPTLRSILSLPEQARLVVVMGNAKPGQARDRLLAALSKMQSDVHVAFIGQGYDAVTERAAMLGIANRVHTPGAIPPTEIVPALRGADLSVMIYHAHSENYQHALPNGLFQSLSAELPLVLSSDLVDADRLNQRYRFGLSVDVRDVSQLQQAVERALFENELHATLRSGASRAARELRWETEQEQLEVMVDSLIGGERRVGRMDVHAP